MERGRGVRTRIVERREEEIAPVSHTVSPPRWGEWHVFISVIVRQSDPIW